MTSYLLYAVVILLYIISFFKDKHKTKKALEKSLKSFEGIMPQFLGIIFVVHHAPIKIITLLNFTPFLIKTAVTGNAAYSGPAATEPNKMASKTPFIPESSPIYFIIVSLGTHISKSPNKSIIGGKTLIICIKELIAIEVILLPFS